MNSLSIDTLRLLHEFETLAGFSSAEGPPPAVTRVLWTKPDLDARAYLKSLFADAGLTVRADPIGNIFARWNGTRPDLAPVGTGSHTDAIPESGRYDGTVGVLGALEAFRALKASGFIPVRSLEILLFTSEEPTRFGLGCLGSRLLSGALAPERAATLTDSEGNTLEAVRRAAGETGDLADVRLPVGYYSAWVELHIEQGPILERENADIGIVTAIAAPATLRVTLTGQGGHAGAVLMPDRHDALAAAAEIVLAVEYAAKHSSSPDTVATVGVLRVHPGAVNSVPSRVVMEIDIRDIDLARRDAAVAAIRAATDATCAARGIENAVEVLNADPPATCASEIVAAIEAAFLTPLPPSLPVAALVPRSTLSLEGGACSSAMRSLEEAAPDIRLPLPCSEGRAVGKGAGGLGTPTGSEASSIFSTLAPTGGLAEIPPPTPLLPLPAAPPTLPAAAPAAAAGVPSGGVPGRTTRIAIVCAPDRTKSVCWRTLTSSRSSRMPDVRPLLRIAASRLGGRALRRSPPTLTAAVGRARRPIRSSLRSRSSNLRAICATVVERA